MTTIRNVAVYLKHSDTPSDVVRAFSLFPGFDGTYKLEGRLMGPLYYQASVSTWIQSENSISAISIIKIANTDGALDDYSLEDFISVEIAEIVNGTKTILATGQVEQAFLDGEKTLNFKIKDASKLLEVPLQDDFYPSSETSVSDPLVTNTYAVIAGTPKPVSIGKPQQVKPVLANPSIHEYHVHDADYHFLRKVYDEMVDITANATQYTRGFALSTPPNRPVTALINGLEDSLGGLPQNIKNQWPEIFDRIGFTDFNQDDLDDLHAEKEGTYAYYQDNTTNIIVKDLLQWYCNSSTAWYWADETGEIRFGWLKEPEITEDVELARLDIVSDINIRDDLAPNLTSKVGASKNWYVHDEGSIASGASDADKEKGVSQYRVVATSTTAFDDFYTDKGYIRDTLLRLNYQAEADDVGALYSKRRRFYSFDSKVKSDIGQTVKITHERFGFSSGENFLCVGKTIDFIKNTYRLTLWG